MPEPSALVTVPRCEVAARVGVRARVPFDCLGAAHSAADAAGAARVGEEYSDGGVVLLLEVDAAGAEALAAGLKDASSGRIEVELLPI